MQKNSAAHSPEPTGSSAVGAAYSERLSPSLWLVVAAAVGAPMTALVFVPVGGTIALVLGGIVAVAIVTALLTFAPRVVVAGGELRAGRAHIPVALLGEPRPLEGDDARAARGPELDRNAWHLLRGGIDPLVVVPVIDPDDPATAWVISSRTPDRLSAAIRREQRVTPRTPGR